MARYLLLLTLFLLAACSQADPLEPSATPGPTGVPVAVASATRAATVPAPSTATLIPTPDATPTPSDTATPTLTPSPESSPTPTPTETPTPTPTSVFACRSAEDVAAFRSPYQVLPGPWPRPAAFQGELYLGNGTANIIHLGFDVEGSPGPLMEILDILDRRGVKTTMYVLGSWADTYPDLVRELARRGHEMGNHAYSHANLKDLPAEEVLAELERTESVVSSLTGQTTRPWFRPPFGSRSDVVIEAAFQGGWTTVVWSGSAEDWREETNADLMCQTMREGSFPGSILYAHTNHPEMPGTIDRYIGEMQARGYTFVPMSVMMSADPGAWLASQ